MNNWILLMVIYAFFLALFETAKKKALEKNSILEVLTKEKNIIRKLLYSILIILGIGIMILN